MPMAAKGRLGPAEFKRLIVETAQDLCGRAGFPWQLCAAQACHESAYGRSVPVDCNTRLYSYNIFGIKGRGPAGSILCLTTEYYRPEMAARLCAQGKAIMTNETRKGLVKVRLKDHFRAYNSFFDSLSGYLALMRIPRYKPVWAHQDDPAAAARAVQACGYATDPGYADKLIRLMRTEGWIA